MIEATLNVEARAVPSMGCYLQVYDGALLCQAMMQDGTPEGDTARDSQDWGEVCNVESDTELAAINEAMGTQYARADFFGR